MRTLELAMKELDDVLAIQTTDGNWNYNPYMHGMANGLIMAKSLLTGEDPVFIEAPKEWLADRPDTGEPIEVDGSSGAPAAQVLKGKE